MQKAFIQCLFVKYSNLNYLPCRFKETTVPIIQTEKYGNSLTTNYNMGMLKKNKSLNTKQPYKPPPNTRKILQEIVSSIAGLQQNWENLKLQDRELKFNILTAAISHFNHDIPNCVLSSDIHSVADLITFFETEITETSAYEDLHAKSRNQLPQNLHIQLEALRFNPENDKFFGGKTAFPGRDTIVSSIKYKRKYEGTASTENVPGYSNPFKKY